MTLIELLVQYYKKPREVAGSPDSLNQCVDWANAYIKDALGLSIIEWTDAKDFASKAGDKYDYIKSTPTNFPLLGDIVIWNGNIGSGHGHIAVALGGDANTFVSTDENWSISQRVTVERHNYDNVAGWLHPKQLPSSDTIAVLKTDFERLVSKSSSYDQFISAGYITPADVKLKLDAAQATIDKLNSDLGNYKASNNAFQAVIELDKKEISKLKAQLAAIPPIQPPQVITVPSSPITEALVIPYLKTLRFWDRIILFSKV